MTIYDDASESSKKKGMAEGSFPFESLPNEIAVGILDMLGLEDKLGSVPLVCKHWHALSQQPACWKTQRRRSSRFCRSSTKKKLLELFIPRTKPLRLRKFELFDRDIGPAGLQLLSERAGQSLEELDIRDKYMCDNEAWEIACKVPSIRSLNLGNCFNLTEGSIEAFGHHCKSLTRLAVYPMSNEHCLAIAQHMPQLEYLEVIEPGGEYLEKGMLAILESCTDLKVLVFEGWQNEHLSRRFQFKIEIVDGKARAASQDKFKEEYAQKEPEPESEPEP